MRLLSGIKRSLIQSHRAAASNWPNNAADGALHVTDTDTLTAGRSYSFSSLIVDPDAFLNISGSGWIIIGIAAGGVFQMDGEMNYGGLDFGTYTATTPKPDNQSLSQVWPTSPAGSSGGSGINGAFLTSLYGSGPGGTGVDVGALDNILGVAGNGGDGYSDSGFVSGGTPGNPGDTAYSFTGADAIGGGGGGGPRGTNGGLIYIYLGAGVNLEGLGTFNLNGSDGGSGGSGGDGVIDASAAEGSPYGGGGGAGGNAGSGGRVIIRYSHLASNTSGLAFNVDGGLGGPGGLGGGYSGGVGGNFGQVGDDGHDGSSGSSSVTTY